MGYPCGEGGKFGWKTLLMVSTNFHNSHYNTDEGFFCVLLCELYFKGL
jgi:hypothetical protein